MQKPFARRCADHYHCRASRFHSRTRLWHESRPGYSLPWISRPTPARRPRRKSTFLLTPKEAPMQYKMIVLELLQQKQELHEQLRRRRLLLATLENYANQLREWHLDWKERL